MPFESPQYTQAPNDLFDSLMREMSETELKVTMAVIRGTLGYHKEGFKLSLSNMAEMTGLSENGVISGAEQAEARGLIERVTDGRKSTEWRVRFSTSASEVRRKRATSPSEVALPHPVRQSTSPSEVQSGLKKDKEIKIARENHSRIPEAKQLTPTNDIKAAYEHLLGYSLNGEWKAGEGHAAKVIGGQFTVEQLNQAYAHYKTQKFWDDKRLTLCYLSKQMPEYLKKNSTPAFITAADYDAEFIRQNPGKMLPKVMAIIAKGGTPPNEVGGNP